MRVVIFGGAGFVGLNIVEALLRTGNDVTAFDINPIPSAALTLFKTLPGQLAVVRGDISDPRMARAAIEPGAEAIILGAAITAGPAREMREPARIMAVNLGSLVPLLERAKEMGVRRIVNLSSVAVYGKAIRTGAMLVEEDAAWPVSLYAISKLTSEQIIARLSTLWGLNACSLRLSTVFGPWEYGTGHRDSLSPPFQIMRAALKGMPALLPRDSRRDWIYAPDVAAGVIAALRGDATPHTVYNLTGQTTWSLFDWGRMIGTLRPGFDCRLAAAGETPTIDLHAAADRLPMSPDRLKAATGWSAAYGLEESARHLDRWWSEHRAFKEGVA